MSRDRQTSDWSGLMARVLELAERGRYGTSPNPRVGAVVLDSKGDVVGEGFHERAGLPHAERVALLAAGERARGGTVLVNLEPCAHHGRTPPCADALVEAGVSRVVFSILDPDPRTAGAGAARLREGGIEVVVGPLEEEAERLNEPFLVSVRQGRPFVHLKWAMSLDGKTATHSRHARWVTGEAAREDGLRLREECDAILVGAGTVIADDPLLTRRLSLSTSIVPYRRIVLDGALRVSPAARVFDRNGEEPETWLVTAVPLEDPRLDAFRDRNATVLSLAGEGEAPGALTVDPRAVLATLQASGVRSLLVEGGGETAWGFAAAGLVDRVTAFVAPVLVGGRDAPSPLGGRGVLTMGDALSLGELEVGSVGRDVRLTARVLARRLSGKA